MMGCERRFWWMGIKWGNHCFWDWDFALSAMEQLGNTFLSPANISWWVGFPSSKGAEVHQRGKWIVVRHILSWEWWLICLIHELEIKLVRKFQLFFPFPFSPFPFSFFLFPFSFSHSAYPFVPRGRDIQVSFFPSWGLVIPLFFSALFLWHAPMH